VTTALDALEPRLRRSLADPDHAALHFRSQLDRLTRVVQAVCLLTEAAHSGELGAAEEKAAVATFFVRRHLVPDHQSEDDAAWPDLVETALGNDLR
jgi:hypothetical protein